jgi:hypothetical protein
LFAAGRPWCGPREIAANRESVPVPPDGFVLGDLMMGEHVKYDDDSCDRVSTLNNSWTAPWRPMAKYFRFNYNRKMIVIDYAKMLIDEQEGVNRYFKAASKLGIQLNIRVERDVIPHPQIVAELGEPSRMGKIAQAAQAGDPWLLGFIDEPNPELADILGIHPTRGIPMNVQSMPAETQAERVNEVIQAPVNADLMAMLTQLAANVSSLTTQVSDLTAERDKKAQQSEKIKAGMQKAKTSKPAQEVA